MLFFFVMSITWNYGDKRLTVESCGLWHEVSTTKDRIELRKNFQALGIADLPFRRFALFPDSPESVVVRLYCTWELARTVELVKDVVEGVFSTRFHLLQLPSSCPMNLPYSVSVPSRYITLKPCLIAETIDAKLRVEEIAFFHFLSKKLTKSETIALKRELRGNKILSEAVRSTHPLLKGKSFGVTTDSDRKRNDHHYVHAFIGYPLVSSREYLERIPSDLAKESMIQIGFQDLPETVLLPSDLEMDVPQGFSFSFLGEKYVIFLDYAAKCITYSSRIRGVLFTEGYAQETFCGRSRLSIELCFKILARFIGELDSDDMDEVLKDKTLLQELFNALFAFRVQFSVPGALTSTPYVAKEFPHTKICELLRRPTLLMPISNCLRAFDTVYTSIQVVGPGLSSLTTFALEQVMDFFRSPLDDGTNVFKNAFAYYGTTSAQLLLHFLPELSKLFTKQVVCELMQLHKAAQQSYHPYLVELYEKYLLIKRTKEGDITIFSLIRKGLEDLDPVQYRLPPNRAFTCSQAEAEHDYLLQLETLSSIGSPLLTAICSLAGEEIELLPFSQDRHILDTLRDGLDRLSYPVLSDQNTFSNVHRYGVDAFVGEFERGIQNYFEEFEIVERGIVQAHIVDFVSRFVSGSELLEPRFKHDILDMKHFIAGLTSDISIAFVDGKVTFRELILRCLYEIPHHEVSINSQLLIDTVHLFLKKDHSLPKRSSPGLGATKAIEALCKINTKGYETSAFQKVMQFLEESSSENEYPYVIHCLTLLRFRIDKDFVPGEDLADPLRAIWQKLHNMDPDVLTEEFFTLFPRYLPL